VVGHELLKLGHDMMTKRPILVAVGGDSGTGKTTLASGLHRIFGSERITNICLDDYHKLDRVARKRARITALDPRANDLDLMADHVSRLRRGETIAKPTYDHSTGTFGPIETIAPREIVVIRGLFPLFTPELKAAFDVRIWLDPQEELKWSWKVKRDCAQRGYSVPEVIRQLMDRRDDQLEFIAPQQRHADLIVRFRAPAGYFLPGTSGDHDDAHLDVRIDLHEQLSGIDLDDLVTAGPDVPHPAIRLRRGVMDTASDGGQFMTLEVDGTISPHLARDLDQRIWAGMETHRHLRLSEIGDYLDGATTRRSEPLALTQLIIALQIARAGIEHATAPAAQPRRHEPLIASSAGP
jgi:phosphoribulokinase